MVILFNKMNRVIGDEAMEYGSRLLYPDGPGGVRQVGEVSVDIVVGHPNTGYGIGVALNDDTGRNIIINGVGGGMQLVAGDHVRMQLSGRIFYSAYDDPGGIIDNGIVRDRSVADIAADAIIRKMRRAVGVGHT